MAEIERVHLFGKLNPVAYRAIDGGYSTTGGRAGLHVSEQ